jgi:hypothetical protein
MFIELCSSSSSELLVYREFYKSLSLRGEIQNPVVPANNCLSTYGKIPPCK